MASVVIHDVEIAAEKVLSWLGVAGKEVAKIQAIEPQVVAGLGAILGAVQTAVQDVNSTATTPSVPMAATTLADLKAVWPNIVSFAATIGIKL